MKEYTIDNGQMVINGQDNKTVIELLLTSMVEPHQKTLLKMDKYLMDFRQDSLPKNIPIHDIKALHDTVCTAMRYIDEIYTLSLQQYPQDTSPNDFIEPMTHLVSLKYATGLANRRDSDTTH